jgi:hypothetical protein
VSLANRMAIASEHISALTVEANEFPDLASEFAVSSVPRTIVNRSASFVGALPEPRFVATTLELAGVTSGEGQNEGQNEGQDEAS